MSTLMKNRRKSRPIVDIWGLYPMLGSSRKSKTKKTSLEKPCLATDSEISRMNILHIITLNHMKNLATRNEELQTMRRDLNELKGLRADVNRMMEYMMGNERENRNGREEVDVGDGGRVIRGIRVEPRMEEQEE
ncbi:hypothetical protein GH714_003516 [Hevea brasiliensis]|uniref:Uncharacterized protein n=1 Tax=Hevea brasiliensis TaxID=3981 RepID=A0A6A6LI75_HEVBR|nr:hypothetical protein GH714_003516 [Hevea brasiliensis]